MLKTEVVKFSIKISSYFIVNRLLESLNLLLILSPCSIFIADTSLQSSCPLILKQCSCHLN